jgi:hypothetical protein
MKLSPHYVLERQDQFLSLFPHRFDYIWAEHPTVGQSPAWKTERRHPLSDRLVQQGSYLYGVRFGAETQYCLLDIDIGSPYHPQRDPFAIARIVAALEPLGLVSYFASTSSYSGGLHLYLPFAQPQSSWKLAIALACLLENAGFKPSPGQLEVFPNPKPYLEAETPSLFNAHRLPLQTGSYLLNQDLQPIWSDRSSFVQQWQFTQNRNDVDRAQLKRLVHQAQRQYFRISGKADKFLNDLNAEIELGWTGTGQTNRLLGRITLRTYIFHHKLAGGEPLEGSALVQKVVEVAQSLPGYRDYCRHQHEIEHRAAEWALCIENSHYFHYGYESGKFKPRQPEVEAAIEKVPTWNQHQSATTRDRIRSAIADLLNQAALPAKATARFHCLLKYGIGGASLYRHRDLWHPQCLVEEFIEGASEEFTKDFVGENSIKEDQSHSEILVEISTTSSIEEEIEEDQISKIPEPLEVPDRTNLAHRGDHSPDQLQNTTSLLQGLGGNVAPSQASAAQNSSAQATPGSNLLAQSARHNLNRVNFPKVELNSLESSQFEVPILGQRSIFRGISEESIDSI